MHIAIVVDTNEISKKELEKDIEKRFGSGVIVLERIYHSTHQYYSNILLINTNKNRIQGQIWSNRWNDEFDILELELKPVSMSWFDSGGEYYFSMDCWLHEPSQIAFCDKAGTTTVRDLDIDLPIGSYNTEKFTPRKV